MEFVALALGMVLGIVAGVLMTPLIDRLAEHRRRLNLLKHISYDLTNAERHYFYVKHELALLSSEDDWRRLSRLAWMKFATRDFLTFPKHDLYVLEPTEANPFNELTVLMSNFDLLCDTLRQFEFALIAREDVVEVQTDNYQSELMQRADEIIGKSDKVKTIVEDSIDRWKWI